jgi:hypothetical protein
MKMSYDSDKLLDPWKVGGKESAKRFAAYFNRPWGGRLYILDKCATLSDAAGNLSNDDEKEYFGELTGVSPQSEIFEIATIIGERFHQWKAYEEELPYDWLALCFLATVSDAESERMFEAGKIAKEGGFDSAIQALLEMRLARQKEEGAL